MVQAARDIFIHIEEYPIRFTNRRLNIFPGSIFRQL